VGTPSSSLESMELNWTESEMGGIPVAPGQMYSTPIRAPNQKACFTEAIFSPNRETAKTCRAMVEGGWCPFGDSCEYIHPTDFNPSLHNFQNQNNLQHNYKDSIAINMDRTNYSPETVNTQFQMDTMSPYTNLQQTPSTLHQTNSTMLTEMLPPYTTNLHPHQMNEMLMVALASKLDVSLNNSAQGVGGQVFELPMFTPPPVNCFTESVNTWNNKSLKLKAVEG